jgi:hypothetical protein
MAAAVRPHTVKSGNPQHPARDRGPGRAGHPALTPPAVRFRYEPASQTIELYADPDRMLCTPSSSRPDWLRAGYGLPVPHTPRRPVSELLDNGPDQGND